MGEWTIVIQGHGIHDNGREDDADALCQRFVEELAAKGQHLQSASFTAGARRPLGIPVKAPEGAFGGHPVPDSTK